MICDQMFITRKVQSGLNSVLLWQSCAAALSSGTHAFQNFHSLVNLPMSLIHAHQCCVNDTVWYAPSSFHLIKILGCLLPLPTWPTCPKNSSVGIFVLKYTIIICHSFKEENSPFQLPPFCVCSQQCTAWLCIWPLPQPNPPQSEFSKGIQYKSQTDDILKTGNS